jgi:PAP2 superfamily
MKRGQFRGLPAVLFAAALVAVCGSAPVALAHSGHSQPADGSAEPVLTWNANATQAITAGRPPASSTVLLGIVHVAMYDTAVALGLDEEAFLTQQSTPANTSAAAAIATATYEVLVARVPSQQAFLDSTYRDYLAGIPDGKAKQRGVALGDRVADEVIAWRANDGFDNPPPPFVQPPPGPGVWEPTAPTPPVDIVLTQVRPLVMQAAGQFRPAAPPALMSERYVTDFAEVKAIGKADSAIRTAQQTETANFWTENGAVTWNRAMRALAIAKNLNLGQATRMFTMVDVSAADGVIGCWEAKFHYNRWRPVQAIQRADTDGNPATSPDPTWQALHSVNHPEYPSGHSCLSTAVTTALRAFFHRDDVGFAVQSSVTSTTKWFGSFSAAQADVTEARIYSGLHFRYSMEAGAQLGRAAARWALTHRF